MSSPTPLRFGIPDLQTGCEILSRIPLANPLQAIDEISAFFDSLLNALPDSADYFLLLEHARNSAFFIAEELSKRYLGKQLPLPDLEEICFQKVVALWKKAAKAYAHCGVLDALANKEAQSLRTATFLHRCILYTGLAIAEHQRAHREYAWGLWLDLHGYYASADEWGVATLPVAENFNIPQVRNTHCQATYVSFLLSDMASCYSLSIRDQSLVRRWAVLWAPLVSLHRVKPAEELPRQVIDLMHDTSLRPTQDCLQTEHIRRVDSSRLSQKIIQVQQQLQQRIPPASLALGNDCSSGQCSVLLEQLLNPWSQRHSVRKFRRRASSGITRVCTGFDEMYYYIAGQAFEQPDNISAYSRRDFDTQLTFRHQENPQQMLHIHRNQLTFSVDTWEVLNESATGFRLMRSTSGRKMAHGQLISLCPHDSEQFLLARVAWLMQEKNGGLIAGIEALPGIPQGVAIKLCEPGNPLASKHFPAFLLPSIPSNPAPSLVLPPGWYRPGRIIELLADTAPPRQIRVNNVIGDGPDFEQLAFTPFEPETAQDGTVKVTAGTPGGNAP